MLARNMVQKAVHGFIAGYRGRRRRRVEEKKSMRHGSKLTETYSWRHRQGVVFRGCESGLERCESVSTRPAPSAELAVGLGATSGIQADFAVDRSLVNAKIMTL